MTHRPILSRHRRDRRRPGAGPLRTVAHWVALLPLLALSLIAPGTMASAAPGGGARFVLCTGTGPVEVLRAPDGSIAPVDPGDTGHDDARPCIWTLHAHPGLDGVPAHVTDGSAAPGAAPVGVAVTPRPVLVPDLSRSARGPPVRA